MCDQGQLYKKCINWKLNCTYKAQDSLVTRIYRVPEAPFPKGFSTVRPLAKGEPSNEECVHY